MAPEEILSSADASRRDFLKKVLVGTTFAAPVLASFSMEGLSPESASAGFAPNQCSNQTLSPCCNLAMQIAAEIAELALEIRDPSVAALLKPLGKALTAMGEGVAKGDGVCTNKPALDQFKKAARELGKFKTLVDELCEDTKQADFLKALADRIIEQITDLVNGECVPV